MKPFINVNSEIGKLNKVMLHKPGKEIENLVPEYLGRLLFDDIPYLKVAQKEHNRFAEILRENGVEVLYLEQLISQVLEDANKKASFVETFLKESHITSPTLYEALYNYLMSKSSEDLVNTVMAGVRKDEVEVKSDNSLSSLMSDAYPFYLDPMPNLYFTRDPGASIGRGITINTMRTEARRRESLFLKYIYQYHPDFHNTNIPLYYDRNLPDNVEGGDELVLSKKVLAIGCSQRTSAEAIEVIAKNLLSNVENEFETVLVLQIPECRAFMHLDTVFTMVDYDKFTIHPAIEGPLNVFEVKKGAKGNLVITHSADVLENILKAALKLPAVDLIRCGGGDPIISGREQWNDGSNTLAIAPGKVITYERNYVTNEILTKHGIEVITMPSAELSRGRGGPRCMSMPLNRDNL
jgi:arginine deiminase